MWLKRRNNNNNNMKLHRDAKAEKTKWLCDIFFIWFIFFAGTE